MSLKIFNEYGDASRLCDIEMLLLDKVHHFCENNHLKHYADGGGAARYKDFIPWNGDSDFFVLCADYDR